MIADPVLTDSFGRAHNYLRISLTERCNLRCFYCMPEEGVLLQQQDSYMTADEIFELASYFVSLGVTKIRLTGGEPLVRKDAAEIIRRLASLKIDLGLTTNAILADRFIPIFTEIGLKKINVSLDSLDSEKNKFIVKRDYFDRIMKNIHLLHAAGIKTKINVVLMNGVNDDEIIPFIELSKSGNIDIRFIEFMPFNGNHWELEKCVPDELILEKVKLYYGYEQIEILDNEQHSTSRNYRVKGYKGNFGLISTITKPFCNSCNRIRLTADGKLKNCLFSTEETDLLTALRAGKEIKALIAEAVWNKKAVRSGMEDMHKDIEAFAQANRSMIRIGG